MKPNIEILEGNLVLYDKINELRELLSFTSKPLLSDIRILPALHEYLSSIIHINDKRDILRVELFVLIYLYNPMQLVSSMGRGNRGVMSAIAKATGITYCNLFKYKYTLMPRYKTYRDFRTAANEAFVAVCEEYAEYFDVEIR